MNLFGNIRIFLIDIDCTCTGSNAIVYDKSIENTTLQFILTKSGQYYTLPEHSRVIVSFDGIECNDADLTLVNRTQGRFNVNLRSNLFMNGYNRQYELKIDVYDYDDRKTFKYYKLLDLTTSIFYSTGLDDLRQTAEEYFFTNTKNLENGFKANFSKFAENYNNPEGYLVVEGYDSLDTTNPTSDLPSKLLNSNAPETYRVIE